MFREFRIAKERIDQAHDRRMSLAWHIAALDRQKKLPALKTLLSSHHDGTTATSEVQSVTQQRAMLQMISEKFGLRLVKPGAAR